MIHIRSIYESRESEKEIAKACEKILPELARATYDKLYAFMEHFHDGDQIIYEKILKKDGPGIAVTVPSRELQDIIRSRFLRSFVEESMPGVTFIIGVSQTKQTRGRYIQGDDEEGNIMLYMNTEKAIEDIYDIFIEHYFNGNRDTFANTVEELYDYAVYEVLVHEFTHAWDDYISSGEYMPSDYKTPEQGDEWGEYARQDIEVNARYSSAVSKLDKLGVKYTVQSFEDAVKEFKSRFEGWKELSNDQQKRLINRLYQWFTEPIENKRERKKAIKYILNQESFRQLDDVEDGGHISNEKVSVPDHLDYLKPELDVESYVKETAQKLIQSKINREEFNNPSIPRNRYKGFSIIEDVISIMEKLERKGKPVDEYRDALENFAQELDVSIDDLYTIAKRFE